MRTVWKTSLTGLFLAASLAGSASAAKVAEAPNKSTFAKLRSSFSLPKKKWYALKAPKRVYTLALSTKEVSPHVVERMNGVVARVNSDTRVPIPGGKRSGFAHDVDVTATISDALGVPADERELRFSGKPIGMQVVDPWYHRVERKGSLVVLTVDQTHLRSVYTSTARGNEALRTIVNQDLRSSNQYPTAPKLTPVKAGGLWFVEYKQTETWHRHVTHSVAVFATEKLAHEFVQSQATSAD